MKAKQDPILRDPAKPAAYYKELVAEAEAQIQRTEARGVPKLLYTVPRTCLGIARALYSAGEAVDVCLHWLNQAVSYELRSIEAFEYSYSGVGDIETRLELYPAGHLVGRAGELVDAFRHCRFEEPLEPYEKGVMDPLCAMLNREPVTLNRKEVDAIKKQAKEWVSLPSLFKAVADKDSANFAKYLEEYLAKSWGPPAEREAKIELKSKEREYAGKWCFLSAAVCQLMGFVPDLPAKAKQYIPVDLVR